MWNRTAAVALVAAAAAGPAAAQTHAAGRPVIDVHFHATNVRSEAQVDSLVRWMDAHGVERLILFIRDTAAVRWHDRAPGRLVIGIPLPCDGGRYPAMRVRSDPAAARTTPCWPEWNGWPALDWIREHHAAGRIGALAELFNVYAGMSIADERLAPYLALAAELDIPVGIHTGRGPPPEIRSADCCPNFDDAYGDPALLRPVLERHPGLRVSLMHAGAPEFAEATIGLMRDYPNVYADMSVINSIMPVEEHAAALRRFIDAGFGGRIMLGTDNWPVEEIVARLDAIEWLTAEQRRAILHDNADRFLAGGASQSP